MKNVIITGGTGFLGSHLCEYVLNKGNRVICIDNNFTGRIENVKSLMDNENFQFVKHDIKEPYFTNEKIDQIYNLACPASPKDYQFNAISTIKTNVLGTLNMLGLAKKHKARILQASTSEIYGNPSMHPQKEEYWGNVNPIGIRSCYDEGKRAAECMCFDYHRQHKVDIRVVRIFNTYGPKMMANDGRVVSNFIIQALNEKDITIYGDGSQSRSFCYVSDLIEAMYKMMECENFNGPVNIGNPDEFTILELANKVIEFTGSKSKIIHEELPKDDPEKRRPDITKAKEKLNWEPKIMLDEGLKKTIEYFKESTE